MEVWTDGSFNRGGTGWSVICPARKLILRGNLNEATNQMAELVAAIQAINYFGTDITVVTDSAYVIGCFTDWYKRWLTNGWRNAQKKPVENQAMIKLGLSLGVNKAKYRHVKSHSGDFYNEMADYYADASVKSLAPQHTGWQIIIA